MMAPKVAVPIPPIVNAPNFSVRSPAPAVRRHGDGEMNPSTETGSIVPDALAALPTLKPTEN